MRNQEYYKGKVAGLRSARGSLGEEVSIEDSFGFYKKIDSEIRACEAIILKLINNDTSVMTLRELLST